jgi:hypothetical protein
VHAQVAFKADALPFVVANRPGFTTLTDVGCCDEEPSARPLVIASFVTTMSAVPAGTPEGIWKLICVGLA